MIAENYSAGRAQFLDLRPHGSALRKAIHGTCVRVTWQVREVGSDECSWPRNGDGNTKLIIGSCVVRDEFLLERPGSSTTNIHISRARIRQRRVVVICTDDNRVLADRNRISKLVGRGAVRCEQHSL